MTEGLGVARPARGDPDSMAPMPATLAELEVRVAALEAERADYRAVQAAVNALGVNQREHAGQLSLWVPKTRASLCDLRVFVDHSAEPVASNDLDVGGVGLGECS